MIILKSHRMQNVPHTLYANNSLIVSLVTSFQQARYAQQLKFSPHNKLVTFWIFLNKFCPNFLAKIPYTLSIHVLNLPHIRKFSKNDWFLSPMTKFWPSDIVFILTLNNLFCFCVILWKSYYDTRASVVIFSNYVV